MMPDRMDGPADQSFPVSAGILFGLGLGGFFDGIVLHQLLQWHHMLTDAGYPPTSIENLKINTLWDGLFHATTYVFVVFGLIVLWRASRRSHIRWSSKLLVGSVLMGFGIFNLVEGVVDHQLLGIHHVNETVPRTQWIYWDLGFLAWGAAMLIGGWFPAKSGTGRDAKPSRTTPSHAVAARSVSTVARENVPGLQAGKALAAHWVRVFSAQEASAWSSPRRCQVPDGVP
jgi:uncharacterized membrane protein